MAAKNYSSVCNLNQQEEKAMYFAENHILN